MKRKTAKEILADSFRELAESRPIDRITIQEIVDNCGYSPATFYRNYKDKYDLIAWDYAQGTARIMKRIGTDGYIWQQTLTDGAFRFDEEREYLANLFAHTSGHDAFIRYMTEINCEALRKHLLEVSGKEQLDKMGYITRTRPESNERKLYLSLTEAGEALRDRALAVPDEMQGCIHLAEEELLLLKQLLDKALTGMKSI